MVGDKVMHVGDCQQHLIRVSEQQVACIDFQLRPCRLLNDKPGEVPVSELMPLVDVDLHNGHACFWTTECVCKNYPDQVRHFIDE